MGMPESIAANATPTEAPSAIEPDQIPRTAQLTQNQGEVNWRATEGETWGSIAVGSVLEVGNQVMTGQTGRAVITFTEGAIVRLAENTVFTIREIGGDAENPETTLDLIKGQIFVIVKSMLGEGHFDVDFEAGQAAVRGSMLSVRVTPSGRVVATCLEGHCTLSDGTHTVSLEYGQQAEIAGIGLLPGAATLLEDYQLNEWLLIDPGAFSIALEYDLIDFALLSPGCNPETGEGCYLVLPCDPSTGIGCDLPPECNLSTGIGCELPAGCNPITGEGCLLPPECDPVTGVGCETPGGCNLITDEGCDVEINCIENPDDPACDPDFCLEYPEDPSCGSGGCLENPDDPACNLDYCLDNPDDPSCGADDPCIEDPASCLPPPPDDPPPLPPPPDPPDPPPKPPSWP